MFDKRYISLLAFTLFAPACQAQEVPTDSPNLPADAVAVPFQSVQQLASPVIGGPQEPMRTVIRDDETWLEFWGQLSGMIMPQPDPPAVDFEKDMVLVAAMGRRSTGGYVISIEGVYESGGTMFVDVLERSPGVGCLSTQVITAPVTAVKVPASAGSVEFMERQSSTGC